MGTDIQAILEHKRGMYGWSFANFTQDLPRDYRTFAMMACVRSKWGPGWGREAMGLPEDISKDSRSLMPHTFSPNDGKGGAHSPSYMLVSELFAILKKSGMLNRWMSVLEQLMEGAGYNLDEVDYSEFRLVFWFVD